MLLASVVAGIIVNVFGVFASFRSGRLDRVVRPHSLLVTNLSLRISVRFRAV